MNSEQVAVILKSFDAPDEVRVMQKGKLSWFTSAESQLVAHIRAGMHRGNMFYIPPVPHDSWVLSKEPYVSLHFLGAEKYATESR